MKELDFTGKTVIVTGGTKGLGRGLATRFLIAGADVVTCARRPPTEPVAAGGNVATFTAADVRDPEQIAGVVRAAVDRTGRVDVLINNAGGAPPADSATVSPRFNEKIVALNLLAPMAFSQAVYPVMQNQQSGGVILNIASVSGIRPNPKGVAYGAAKAGLLNMSETLAVEWGPRIRVLTVTVGLIVTDEAHLYYGDEAGIAAVGETIALGRMGRPEDVADVCLFLASPLARWMTGANIKVHGGGEKPAYLGASTGEVATSEVATSEVATGES
ncbi:SDR family oxidoreductase [Candidatus Poriferisocius sp.]|uniref:SDR family oxidoreductase n=1 Tax=Candidatus Poriferisocius sp. TaxID=3101276 RepID=UPI003B02DE74